ncbi:MAG: phenylacetate--CoA ligase family protein [Roseiflexaceae bacterium]
MTYDKPTQAEQTLAWFLHTPLDQILSEPTTADLDQRRIDRFRHVAATVPAYRQFLADQGVDPATITAATELASIPPVSKQNYIQRYPLAERCRDGRLDTCDFVAVSSGSTGQPTFWPRFLADELQIAIRFEQIFRDSFAADQRRTLAVVCFTLGTWVGGMFTASCSRYLASKGYPITVITPGNNRDEIFRVVEQLGPQFEQVVLLGYPPALKDIIDHGRSRGIEWANYQIKLVFAGEVFSEEWRSLVGERTGGQAICYDSASLYGTADAGVLANETPLSIVIRRYLAQNPAAARELFGESRLPTLAQYDPRSRDFEASDRTLLFSGENGIPLIRYNILDTGGVVGYHEMLAFLARHGFDPGAALHEAYGSHARGIRPLPFVFVFGRSDFTVSFFGANIYPENVTVGLEQPAVSAWVTGKFVLEVREAADHNPFLSITVELAPGVSADPQKQEVIAEAIMQSLLRLNSEYANYVPPAYRTPVIQLRAAGDAEYFPIGVKHRYTRRT